MMMCALHVVFMLFEIFLYGKILMVLFEFAYAWVAYKAKFSLFGTMLRWSDIELPVPLFVKNHHNGMREM